MTASHRKTTPLLIVIVVLLFSPLFAPGVSHADELSDKQIEAAQIADQLEALQLRLMELDSQFELTKAELAKAQDAVATAQQQADVANAELERISGELQTFSVRAYITGSDDPAFNLIIKSRGNDAPQKQGYIEIAAGSRKDMLDRFEATKSRAEAESDRLAEAQAASEARAAALQQSQAEAQQAVERQSEIKARIDGELGVLVAQEQQRRAAEAARQAEQQTMQLLASAPAQSSNTGTGSSDSTSIGPIPSQQPVTTPGAPSPSPAPTPTPAPTPAPAPAPTPTPTTQPPAPTPVTPPPTTPPPPPATTGPRSTAGGAVNAAMGKIGSPYVWAGGGPNVFDCSGLTMWAWAQVGVYLPHYSGAQYTMTRRISLAEAQPGDLIFFWAPRAGGDPSHVGMYIGGGKMVHAPSAGNFVRVDSIYWWTGARIAAGRV